ncbi:MAG: DUF5694 domain-containing protein [Xanthomonadales bacterium]|nr:DUF5694 domain-containing protein [Xanthomonadales bacterium]
MRFATALVLIASFLTVFAEEGTLTLEEFQQIDPVAEIMILGTFHFRDKGLDSYKPEVDIDIFSVQRQAELREVLDRIKQRFDPTKIALEARGDWAERMTEKEYPAWLRDEFELKANEVYQVGFRLGKELGHDRLYFVDVMGRRYADLPEDVEAYARSKGQLDYLSSPWDERYTRLYRHDDLAKAKRPLIETFLAMNDPERLLVGHGHYLLQAIALGEGDEYVGADLVSGWWYNRNLRIFANIRRLAEPGDRILLVIGAGHVPILLHAAQASPEFRVVPVANVLTD